jgi:hypothetical protein
MRVMLVMLVSNTIGGGLAGNWRGIGGGLAGNWWGYEVALPKMMINRWLCKNGCEQVFWPILADGIYCGCIAFGLYRYDFVVLVL